MRGKLADLLKTQAATEARHRDEVYRRLEESWSEFEESFDLDEEEFEHDYNCHIYVARSRTGDYVDYGRGECPCGGWDCCGECVDWGERDRKYQAALRQGCKCQEKSDSYAVLDGFLEEVEGLLADLNESLDQAGEDNDESDEEDESDAEDVDEEKVVHMLSEPHRTRVKQTARKSTGGWAPGTRLAVERGGVSTTVKIIGEAGPSAAATDPLDEVEKENSEAEMSKAAAQKAAEEKAAEERAAKEKAEAKAQARTARILETACDVVLQLAILTSFLAGDAVQLLKGRSTDKTNGSGLVLKVAEVWMRVVPMLTKEPKIFDGQEASKGRAALGEKMREWAKALRCDELLNLVPLIQVPPQHETMQAVLLGTAQLDEPRASTELRLGLLQRKGEHAQMLALADRTSLLDWSCVSLLLGGRLREAAARLQARDPSSLVPISTASVYRLLAALAACKSQADPLEYAKLTCVFAGAALLRQLSNTMPPGATAALQALIEAQKICREPKFTPSDWFITSCEASLSPAERYHHAVTALLAPTADSRTVLEASALLLCRCAWGIDTMLSITRGLQQHEAALFIVAKGMATRGCLALTPPKPASAAAADTTAASKKHLEEILKCLQSRSAPGTTKQLLLGDASRKLLELTESYVELMTSAAATADAKEEVVKLLHKWGAVFQQAGKAAWAAAQILRSGNGSAAIGLLQSELTAGKEVDLPLTQRILSFANDATLDAQRRSELVSALIQRAAAATPSPLALVVLQSLGEHIVGSSSPIAPGHVAAVLTAWLHKALNPPSTQPSYSYYSHQRPAPSPDAASAAAALKAIVKLDGEAWTYAEPALFKACGSHDFKRLTAPLAKQFAEDLASAGRLALSALVGMRFAVASGGDLTSLKFALRMASTSAVQGETIALQQSLNMIRSWERFSDAKVRSLLKLKPIDQPLLELRPSYGDGAAEATQIRTAAQRHARAMADAVVALVSDLHDAAKYLVNDLHTPFEHASVLLDIATSCCEAAVDCVASMQVSFPTYECKINHGAWSSTANCAKCRPSVYAALHSLEQRLALAEMLGSRSTASKLKSACCTSAKPIVAEELRKCGLSPQTSLLPSPPVFSAAAANHSRNHASAADWAAKLAALSTREIRQLLQGAHVDVSGCVERRDLEELAIKNPEAFDSDSSAAPSGKRSMPQQAPADVNKRAKSKPASSSIVIDLGDSD